MELYLNGLICFTDDLVDAIENSKEDVHITINSPGGVVTDALNVVNAIQKCPHTVNATVEVMACSAAAMIALSCDNVEIEPTGIIMIHNSWGTFTGNKKELQNDIDAMAAMDGAMHKAIETHCKDKSIIDKMEDGDVWMTGTDAAQYFDNITVVGRKRSDRLAAVADLSTFLMPKQDEPQAPQEEPPEPEAKAELPKAEEPPKEEPKAEIKPEQKAAKLDPVTAALL